MCGINKILYFENRIHYKKELIKRMNDEMIYRGPNDEGIYVDNHIAMGMRRLSIIDVASGKQPLYNENKSIVLICNGEINLNF